jgi:hypothetical protein
VVARVSLIVGTCFVSKDDLQDLFPQRNKFSAGFDRAGIASLKILPTERQVKDM